MGDAREMELMDDVRPFAYLPVVGGEWERFQLSQMVIVIRTAGDPLTVLPAVRRIVREADSTVPLSDANTMEVLGGGAQRRQLLARENGSGLPGDRGNAIAGVATSGGSQMAKVASEGAGQEHSGRETDRQHEADLAQNPEGQTGGGIPGQGEIEEEIPPQDEGRHGQESESQFGAHGRGFPG